MTSSCAHEHPEHPEAQRGSPTSVAAKPLLTMVRWYQVAREGRPSPCRFVPSCSTYASEALQEHGAVRGTWLSVRRLSRCHPWGGEGYDPVPPRSTWNTDDAAPPATDPRPDQKVP